MNTAHSMRVSLNEDLQCSNRKLLDIGFQLWLKFVLKLYLAHMNSNAFRTLRVRGERGFSKEGKRERTFTVDIRGESSL